MVSHIGPKLLTYQATHTHIRPTHTRPTPSPQPQGGEKERGGEPPAQATPQGTKRRKRRRAGQARRAGQRGAGEETPSTAATTNPRPSSPGAWVLEHPPTTEGRTRGARFQVRGHPCIRRPLLWRIQETNLLPQGQYKYARKGTNLRSYGAVDCTEDQRRP